jgi:hypothetical protein
MQLSFVTVKHHNQKGDTPDVFRTFKAHVLAKRELSLKLLMDFLSFPDKHLGSIQIRPQALPSTLFLISHSLIILKFDAI